MSVNTENTIEASEAPNAESTSETITRISSDLNEERIEASLKPLSAQILTLTQLLNQLIQENSAKTNSTAGRCTHRPQTEPPLS